MYAFGKSVGKGLSAQNNGTECKSDTKRSAWDETTPGGNYDTSPDETIL